MAEIDVIAIPADVANCGGEGLGEEKARVQDAAGEAGYEYVPEYRGLDDLVSKLREALERRDCLRTLEIDAHGSPMFCNCVNDTNLADFAKALGALPLCKDCRIYLSGCNTGLTVEGKQSVAQQLSAAFTGCAVFGSVGYVRGTHMEGTAQTTETLDFGGMFYPAWEGARDATGDDCFVRFRGGNPA